MTDHAHDRGLISLIIEGVAHGLAVDGQAFVLPTKSLVPTLQRPVEILGIDADQ